ncbi:DUF2914 domain-containing protein [Chondromyces crocatus]|uniref:DUF2914 domain-containing protein n=1 Tax=Chondromyces crocatus TaxID=52 RepID=A0A0K1E5V7_CHOCO|nr:DUF2914 domain-containing protein [Chondromyces crocatus]AKT36260.1 uncharacterized protein CMC5_003740 [Chondromyces crocatus]
MKTATTWISALALSTAMLALGCNDATPREQVVAPVQNDQVAPSAQVAPAATAASLPSCATPTPSALAQADQPTSAEAAPKTAAAKTAAAKTAAARAEGRAPGAAARDGAPVKVKRLVLTEQIEGREPSTAKSTFSGAEAKKIYAFVEVENPSEGSSEITVSFEPPDGSGARGQVTLDVGASRRWRTWAFTRGAKVAGSWTAVVHGPSGEELARAPFEVTL